MVGKAIAGRRQDVVLATKVRGRMGPGPNQVGLSRLHIIESVEASLKRLDTDYIDLYQIHRFDPLTNIEDTLRALDDLVRAGKVRYIGCSNLPAWHLMKSLAISREQQLERFRCTQSYYSLAGRDLERETIPLLKDQGLGLLVWSPLAGGFLSGKFTRDSGDESARRAKFDFPPVNKERGFAILDVLAPIATGARRDRAAGRARLDPGERRGDQRDHRRRKTAAARRQPEGDRRRADGGRHEGARRGQQAHREYPAWMDSLGSDRRPGERRY